MGYELGRDRDCKERVFKDAARFLGVSEKSAGAGISECAEILRPLFEQAYEELLIMIRPKHILIRRPVSVCGGDFTFDWLDALPSKHLCRLFEGAAEGFALLSTLGSALDLRVRRLMLTNPALGAALGACGSAYVDEYIDSFLRDEQEKLLLEGKTLSPRFSPGYGDVPLSYQKQLLKLLDARRIGVTLTEACLMLPEKSVSALIAIKEIAL